MTVLEPSLTSDSRLAQEPAPVPASDMTRPNTNAVVNQGHGDAHATALLPEQAHWLSIQTEARLLACRSGSCGE
jgi:hypothetical protein